VQANVGEVIAWRRRRLGLTDGMIQGCEPWGDGACSRTTPPRWPMHPARPGLYGRVKEIIEHTVGSSLIYLNSNADRLQDP
jgi:4-hydroxyphenylacetate 3-monooxygenase